MEIINNMGFLALPLFLLSLIGLAVILERIIYFARLPRFDKCSCLNKVKIALKKNAKLDKKIRDELASQMLQEVKKPYFSGIKILRIIAVTTPMLGLLGTVIGIIKVFKKISLYEGPVYPALIADGLWTAMLTTAAGLIIALPCLFAAFIFARIAERRMQEYQNILNDISLKLEGVKF